MTQTADPISSSRIDAGEVRQQLAGKHVCPFCGVIRADPGQPCPRCTMDDTPATRSGTRQRIGPWFVLQARNPSAPGMKFATLLSLVKKGHVTPRSIVRGPTTHQLWTFAAAVRGLSREFGLCNWCGERVETTASACPHCDRTLEPPGDPDTLLEAGAAPAPEMNVTAAPATPETGMDGGISLDLQADDDLLAPAPKPTPRPSSRPASPSIASASVVSPSIASPLTPSPLSPARSASAAGPAATGPVSVPITSPMTSHASAGAISVPAKQQQEEAILTARELAAAFQLDFKPPPGAIVGDARVTKPRKRGGAFKTILALLLIGGAGAGIVLFARPDLRERTTAWLNDTWSNIQRKLEAPPDKPTRSDTPKPDAPKAGSPAPITATPPVAAIPAPKPEPVVKAPEPPPEVRPQIAPKPEPMISPAPKPEPRPEPPPDIRPEPTDLTPQQAASLARQWRLEAMDAEGTDWPRALRLYEKIEQLPKDAWPADLAVRLKRARDAASR